MQFSEILGQEHIKSHLTKSADLGRIPHAQLFVGPEGSGTLPMAIAYAQFIVCSNSEIIGCTGGKTFDEQVIGRTCASCGCRRNGCDS